MQRDQQRLFDGYHQRPLQGPGLTNENTPQSDGRSDFESRDGEVLPSVKQGFTLLNSAATTGNMKLTTVDLILPWIGEILACLFCCCTLGAIVGTLYPFQGRPLPYLPFRISVNGLLSIYTLCLKTSLAAVIQPCIGQLQWSWFQEGHQLYDAVKYDRAGRGLWGATQWFFTPRFDQALVQLSVTILILAVIIDPSLQEIIAYDDCQTQYSGQQAVVPRTNYFSPYHNTSYQSLPLSLKAGLLSSAYLTPADITIDGCSTGNCTFEQYSTAAYCSVCTDLSDDLEFTFQCPKTPSATDQSNMTTVGCNTANITTEIISTLTLSDLHSVFSTWSGCSGDDSCFLSSDLGLMTGIWDNDFTVIMGKSYFSVNDLGLNGEATSGCNAATSNDWNCRGYGAAKCKLYPCVKTFNLTVTNGAMHEVLVDQSSEVVTTQALAGASATFSSLMTIVDIDCATAEEKQLLQRQGYDTSQRFTPFNITMDMEAGPYDNKDPTTLLPPLDGSFPGTLFERQCAYMWDAMIEDDLTHVMSFTDNVSGTLSARLSPTSGDTHTTDLEKKYVIADIYGPLGLQVLFNMSHMSFESVRQYTDNIAAAFTNNFRTNGVGQNFSAPATGAIMHYAVCLDVQWAWMTAPASLTALTICVLIMTIIVAGKTNAPVWKTSFLPFLIHGTTWVQDGSQSIKSMETAAKDIKIQLSQASWEVYLDKSESSTRFRRVKPHLEVEYEHQ